MVLTYEGLYKENGFVILSQYFFLARALSGYVTVIDF